MEDDFHVIEGVLTKYAGTATQVVIPEGVIKIDEHAFAECTEMTEVTIPASVTSIGAFAFACCSGLTTLTIPAGVEYIHDYAFFNCDRLESIVVEESNARYDSRNGCNAIIETATNVLLVVCKNTVIPDSVLFISDAAFFCKEELVELVIPDSVISIGKNAFHRCDNLTISCYAGSYAEKYAREEGIPYRLIDADNNDCTITFILKEDLHNEN